MRTGTFMYEGLLCALKRNKLENISQYVLRLTACVYSGGNITGLVLVAWCARVPVGYTVVGARRARELQ